jgi:Uma2 family endonuclease
MSMSVLQPPLSVPSALPRKRFTRSEVEQMEARGVFAGQRLELIDGDLIDKAGQNPPHASAIVIGSDLLHEIFGKKRVRTQLPIEAGPTDRERSLPGPDFAVVAQVKPDFNRRHPAGSELALVIEISDTTLDHDATTRRDIYARSGVPEYWVLDLNGRRLLVHRDLNIEAGEYASIRICKEDESVAVGDQPVVVSALLPEN